MTHHNQCRGEKDKYSDLRKVHGPGNISMRSFFKNYHVEKGDHVIIEEKGSGKWEITAARIEKKVF